MTTNETTTTQNDDGAARTARVLERIKKLLALAERNPSVEEAASAAAEAQRLMEEYHVAAAALEDRPPPVEERQVQDDAGRGRPTMWWGWLAQAFAEHLHVQVLRDGGTDRMRAIGRGPDVAALCVMYASVKVQLEAAYRAALRAPGQRDRRFRGSFFLGAVTAVRDRLRRVAEQSAPNGAALVLARKYGEEARAEIERWKRERGIRVRTKRVSVRCCSNEGFDSGYEAGSGVDLQPRARMLAERS